MRLIIWSAVKTSCNIFVNTSQATQAKRASSPASSSIIRATRESSHHAPRDGRFLPHDACPIHRTYAPFLPRPSLPESKYPTLTLASLQRPPGPLLHAERDGY